MNKLYKISSHPSLPQVDQFETGPDAQKKLEFAKVALTPDILRELPGGTYWKSDGIMDDHMKLSGKMKTLDYLLRRYLRKRNRVLVFSYSTASLNVIQNHIKVTNICSWLFRCRQLLRSLRFFFFSVKDGHIFAWTDR